MLSTWQVPVQELLVENWTPSAFSGVAALLGTATVMVFQALVWSCRSPPSPAPGPVVILHIGWIELI